PADIEVRPGRTGPRPHGLALLVAPRRLPAQPVDGATPGDRRDPGTRLARQPGCGPRTGGVRERLLRGLLRQVEVAERPGEHGDDPASLVAERAPAGRIAAGAPAPGRTPHPGLSSMNGRTAMGHVVAAAIRSAHRRAVSRSGTSMMLSPPITSLVSTNGPSVVVTDPSRAVTTVAVPGSWRPPPNTQAPSARSWRCTSMTFRVITSRSSSLGAVEPAG